MADYSQPYMPSVLNDANALATMQSLMQRQSQNQAAMSASALLANGDYDTAEQLYRSVGMDDLANQARLRGVSIKAGNAAANGDYQGAADHLLRSGYLDQAQTLKKEHLEDVNRLFGIGAQIAQLPDLTPLQWKQFLGQAKQDGFDTSQFEDFKTGPQLLTAYAGKVMDVNKQRLEQLKAFPPHSATMAGQDGNPDTEGLAVYNPNKNAYDFTPGTPGLTVDAKAINGKAGSDSSTQIERVATAYQDDWKKTHPNGPELGRKEALNAASIAIRNNSGTGIDFELGPDGQPRLKTSGQQGTTGYARTEQGAYNLAANREAAKFDIGTMARKTLGNVIQEHSEMLDPLTQRPDFEEAMRFLHTPDGVRFWGGEALPLGTVPQTANDIVMTVKSLAHEYGNFVAAGHKGAMSEREGRDLENIVGQLENAPTGEAFRHNLETLRGLANAFQHVPTLGSQGVSKPSSASNPTDKKTIDGVTYEKRSDGNWYRVQ
jgi:hypothetical protein